MQGEGLAAAGLDVALRVCVNGRCKDQDRKLRGMTHEEAVRHLVLMWDKLPLEFDFSGGAADGGAGASSVALDRPTRRSSRSPTWAMSWGRCWRRC